MRSLLLSMTACVVLGSALPARAAMVVPAVMVAPAAVPETAGPSPLLHHVWWDRWHHWHHRHWHRHWYPRG